jgi:membrane-bound lytic murein transglycosylase A
MMQGSVRVPRPSLLAMLCLLSACVSRPPPPPPPPEVEQPERVRYERVAWSAVPGWHADQVGEAWSAFVGSCVRLRQRAEWVTICDEANTVNPLDSATQRRFFETHLDAHRLLRDMGRRPLETTGLITGYYEPMLEGARRRTPRYSVPLYTVPGDLLVVDLAALYPELKGKRIRGRVQGNKVVPYYTRAELESSSSLRGKELVWVADPVDAFFLQVQGSGRVRLESGETIRVQFAEVNGHPYRSIGKYLVEQGELTLDNASAPNIREWVRTHPARAQEVLNVNPSVVFFNEAPLNDPNEGPKGALGVPLTAGRSIAVDPRFIPLGAPVFLSTTYPATTTPLQRLVLAQDTGGAIKGVLRADFFWGLGATAGEQAGRMRQEGSFWLLWPKGAALPST